MSILFSHLTSSKIQRFNEWKRLGFWIRNKSEVRKPLYLKHRNKLCGVGTLRTQTFPWFFRHRLNLRLRQIVILRINNTVSISSQHTKSIICHLEMKSKSESYQVQNKWHICSPITKIKPCLSSSCKFKIKCYFLITYPSRNSTPFLVEPVGAWKYAKNYCKLKIHWN